MRVGAVQPLLHQEHIKLVATVKRQEKLKEIAVSDDEARGEHDFSHVVEVPHGNEVLKAVRLAQGDGDRQHHGEAGIDCAGDKVGGEDGGVPSRNNSDGKVEADHGVHAENKRGGQSSEKQIRGLIAVPMANGTAPAHGQHAVNELL